MGSSSSLLELKLRHLPKLSCHPKLNCQASCLRTIMHLGVEADTLTCCHAIFRQTVKPSVTNVHTIFFFKLKILIFLGDLLLVWGLLVLCLSWNSAIYQNCHAIRNLTVKPAVYGLSCILVLKRIPFLAVMPAVKQTIKLSDTNYHAIGSYD